MARNTNTEENAENLTQNSGSDVSTVDTGITQTKGLNEKSDLEYIAELKNVRDVNPANLERFDAAIKRNAETVAFNKQAMRPETKERLQKLQNKYGISRPRLNASKTAGGVRISVMPGNRPIMKEQENGYQASIPEWYIPLNLYVQSEGMRKGVMIPGRDAINIMNALNKFFDEYRDIMEFARDFAVDIEDAEASLKKSFDAF